MKVLWLCNSVLPEVAYEFGVKPSNTGGWLSGQLNSLRKNKEIELAVAFPLLNDKKIKKIFIENITYFGFTKKKNDPTIYDKSVEKIFDDILNDFQPDIIHIFGTEFPHTLSMIRAFNNPNKVVIGIQGLCSVIEKHYYASLPNSVVKSWTLRDLIKRDNIYYQQLAFKKRGYYEIEAIKNVNHVIGRTTWDVACTKQINPIINYHKCNETLRSEFYKHRWTIEKCQKHSIFVSQCSYPVKGFHHMLEAMKFILKQYPDAILYTTGDNLIEEINFKQQLKQSTYQRYLRYLINKYDLQDHVIFLGNLNEAKMCNQYLKSHVFVSASSIENSPNSVGEAMLLGVPIVASDVGGVTDMLTHKNDGFVYQSDAPYMLSYYISKIFEDDDLAMQISKHSRETAAITHDRKRNLKTLVDIYNGIYEGGDINESNILL